MDVPLHLAAGSEDPMTSADAMRRHDAGAIIVPGFGHNVHVQAPQQLWQALEPVLIG
jgi:pimeloyl-ACP methyl ester carboxylesterase